MTSNELRKKEHLKETVGQKVVLLRPLAYVGTESDVKAVRDWLGDGTARIVGRDGGYTWCVSDYVPDYILIESGVVG